MGKSLADKAIDIKGKQYVLVSDRIIYFNETYPEGSITTELVTDAESTMVIVKATVKPSTDSKRQFTGYSQAKWGDGYINKTSALENCETSAVGRALAMMGIGVIDSIASVDEINKAGSHSGFDEKLAEAKQKVYKAMNDSGLDDAGEMRVVLVDVLGKATIDTVEDADKVIERLKK